MTGLERRRANQLTTAIIGWLVAPDADVVATGVAEWDEADWKQARSILLTQGIGPQIHRTFCELGADHHLDPTLRAWLQRQYDASTQRVAVMHQELAAILAGATRIGVPVMPMKGGVLSVLHYPDPALRPMADLDVLVRPTDEPAFATVLEELGYRLMAGEKRDHRTYLAPDARVVSWEVSHPDNPRPVEVHTHLRRILWRGVGSPDLAEFLWQHSHEVEHLGQRAWIPSDAVLLADIAQHATRHAVLRSGRVLQWWDLAQVARGVAACDAPSAAWVYPPLRFAARAFPDHFAHFELEPLAARTPPRLRRLAEQVPLDERAGLNVASINYSRLSPVHRRWARGRPTAFRVTFAAPSLPPVLAYPAYLGRLAGQLGTRQLRSPAKTPMPTSTLRLVIVNHAFDASLANPEALLDRFGSLTGWAEGSYRAGVDVVVLQRFWRDAELERNGVRYEFIGDTRPPLMRAWHVPARIHRRAVELNPDVVHVNGFGFPLATRALRMTLPRQTALVVQHHGGQPMLGLKGIVQRWGLSAADGELFAAAGLAEAWRTRGGGEENWTFEVMEGSTRFEPQAKELARRTTGLHGGPVLLWVGHLNANKDPLTVLDGFARLLEGVPGARLYMAYGKTDLLPTVRARLEADERLAAAVTLLGWVPHDEIVRHFCSADYFVLGSHREAGGYALVEAMRCGVVPIVTDIPSFRVMTDNGRIGALWHVGSADAFYRAATTALALPHDEQARAARAFFDANLSFDAIGRRAKAIYQAVSRPPAT